MAEERKYIRHRFGGGWAPDFGPSADVQLNQELIVTIPYLVNARDLIYELDGGPHMHPGTARVNSSVLESGAAIMGGIDYWRMGTTGVPVQKRVIHVGTKIKADAADGTFADILTGMTQGAIPSYSIFDDILIMSNTADVPKSYNQTTAGNLAGSPPNFAFSCVHKQRAWAAGVDANPSRLYYSVLGDPEDWAGSGSGSIDVDTDNGDMITGLVSWKNDLFVFKGPYKGSIHRITGSSPTGTDAFAKIPFIFGAPLAWHNAIFPFADDIGFVTSQGSVRSLKATAAFGDFNEVALSRGIDLWLSRVINPQQIRQVHAVSDTMRSRVYITLPVNGSATNNFMMVMDYRFQPPRWSYVEAFTAAGLFYGNDPADSSRQKAFFCGYDGYLRRLSETRSIDSSTALSFRMTTPFLDYGSPEIGKTFTGGAIGFYPHNNGDVTYGWTRDSNAQQTQAVGQYGSDVLGSASANEFTLGTSTLGGSIYVNSWFDAAEGGEFRQIQYDITGNVNYEDVEIHSLISILEPGTVSEENP